MFAIVQYGWTLRSVFTKLNYRYCTKSTLFIVMMFMNSNFSRCNSLPPAKKTSSNAVSNRDLPAKKHHHHHHRHGADADAGVCSNKFIQITVITLVLVMAFW